MTCLTIACRGPAAGLAAMALLAGLPAAAQTLPAPGEPFSYCKRLSETVPERILKADQAGEPVPGLVLDVSACLGHPNPAIRDTFAYGTLAGLLREGDVPEAERRELLQALMTNLNDYIEDPNGFLKPFSVLVLAEVARTDRIDPWMTGDERDALVEAGAAYLESVEDYRGFKEGEGWRHGVAHAADLLMQLSLNPAIGKAEAERMLEAVAAQISSYAAPAFVFDEPRRLSRPVLYMASRELLSEAELTAWFRAIANPAPLQSWDEAFTSESALARRHNLRAFGYAVLVAATENEDEALKRLRPGALHLLTVIP